MLFRGRFDEIYRKMKGVFYILPVAYISAESAATGAVSQRKMRGPIEQMCSFIMRASSASNGSKPPSGPVRMAAEAIFPALSTACSEYAASHRTTRTSL